MFFAVFALIIGFFFGNMSTSFYYRICNNLPINGIHIMDGKPPHCSVCKHNLRFVEYFPIFNWFSVKKNRCNYCGSWIDPIYHILEFLGALMSLFAYLMLDISGKYVFILPFSMLILSASSVYYKTHRAPFWLILLISFMGVLENIIYDHSVLPGIVSTIIFITMLVAYIDNYNESNDNWHIANCAFIALIWLPLYASITLLALLYSFYKQHKDVHQFIYAIFFFFLWFLVILF